MNLADVKRELRSNLSSLRAGVPELSRWAQSAAACLYAENEVLSSLRRTKEDKGLGKLVIFTYLVFRDETSTMPLVERCWAEGDIVLVPRVNKKEGTLVLHQVTQESDIKQGAWGIPEPAVNLPIWSSDRWGDIDLIVVPALGYDQYGGRIGYGGGYYDRFMEQLQRMTVGLEAPLLSGICFTEQIVREVPMEDHDFRLDMLFTATGVIYTNNKGSDVIVDPTPKQNRNVMTHFNEQGRAEMVDISGKDITVRIAVASTKLIMQPSTLQAIKEGRINKGDVLAVAQVAGIQGAKRTADWIPMCHPLPLTGVNIEFSDNGNNELYIHATVKTEGKTGVEMEALTAVSAAALTVYDMCKALQKDIVIGPTQLESKTGGKSGDYSRNV